MYICRLRRFILRLLWLLTLILTRCLGDKVPSVCDYIYIVIIFIFITDSPSTIYIIIPDAASFISLLLVTFFLSFSFGIFLVIKSFGPSALAFAPFPLPLPLPLPLPFPLGGNLPRLDMRGQSLR